MSQTLLLCLTVLSFCDGQPKQQDPDVLTLAKNANVFLITTPINYTPPNTAIGVTIPHKWDVSMKSLNACRAVLNAISKPKYLSILGPIKESDFESLKRLADEFEGLEIKRNQIASMGILCDTSLEVFWVSKEMPFNRSSLKRGDKIVSINGTPVKFLPDLQLELCNYTPGSKVMIGVSREDKEHILTVELGTYPRPNRIK